MPDETPDDVRLEIERLLELGLSHLSVYALTIEPGTQFGELHRLGKLRTATEDAFAGIFETVHARLADEGFEHYEVSNYARPGERSIHNAHYWRGGAYVGLGAAAVGCLDHGEGRARRWRNEPDPARYLESGREEWDEHLGPDDLVREALMLGLRTSDGVDLGATGARAGKDVRAGREAAIARREARGDLVVTDDTLRVPHERWLHLDGIVADLF
jgi:oxygen-independent coproporphyrinogen-3 oxidase